MARQSYINPYVAGFLLGLVLLSSFVIAGRGLGASGAINQTLVHSYQALNFNSEYLLQQQGEEKIFESWIVIEVIGIFLGALISARQSGRARWEIIKSTHISNRRRIFMALLGGALMGLAARLARGCTSGQALTGGALLSAGSWAFMLAVFIGAYAAIWAVKRSWS